METVTLAYYIPKEKEEEIVRKYREEIEAEKRRLLALPTEEKYRKALEYIKETYRGEIDMKVLEGKTREEAAREILEDWMSKFAENFGLTNREEIINKFFERRILPRMLPPVPSAKEVISKEAEKIRNGKWRTEDRINASIEALKKYGIPYYLKRFKGYVEKKEALEDVEKEIRTVKGGYTGSFIWYVPDYEEDPPADEESAIKYLLMGVLAVLSIVVMNAIKRVR